MKKLLISLALLCSSSVAANTVHISPDMRIGPYAGSGISGGGIQIGLADTLGLDALYLSYSHTSAEFWQSDKDRLKTYRIGGQYQFVQSPKMALQLEAGIVDYEGSRQILWEDRRYKEGQGASISASWVMFINDHVGFRAGADFNFIDSDDTFLSNTFSATFSTGVVFQF
ncbi:DUF481 domain-containing protein [uncultured Vibrio sp.]|uniref:DUF481 domain-containing protein n=1 Tax=uncultured Vibrio sp. TaxID=114054 RepID=UPI0009167CCB|nr:DUF481 domain-containing protein [uncultured Vibrio sp.]OIQ25724.1 MAG: hypothetical protein BM561_04800 [Vibrio sp. MedPE-SWchi]